MESESEFPQIRNPAHDMTDQDEQDVDLRACLVFRAVLRSPIWGTKSAQCALNVHCSNSFVFGKNCPNFD
jgi:hypothetical protein